MFLHLHTITLFVVMLSIYSLVLIFIFEILHKMEKSARMDGTDFGPLPGWKSNNVKVRNYKTEATDSLLRIDLSWLVFLIFLFIFCFFSHGYGCSKRCILNWITTAVSERNGYVILWSVSISLLELHMCLYIYMCVLIFSFH